MPDREIARGREAARKKREIERGKMRSDEQRNLVSPKAEREQRRLGGEAGGREGRGETSGEGEISVVPLLLKYVRF